MRGEPRSSPNVIQQLLKDGVVVMYNISTALPRLGPRLQGVGEGQGSRGGGGG